MIKKSFLFSGVSIFCVVAGFLAAQYFFGYSQPSATVGSSYEAQSPVAPVNNSPLPVKNNSTDNSQPAASQSGNKAIDASQTMAAVQLKVPFIVQAPFGNWSDPVFQNACEESSIVMAMGWLKGIKTITP